MKEEKKRMKEEKRKEIGKKKGKKGMEWNGMNDEKQNVDNSNVNSQENVPCVEKDIRELVIPEIHKNIVNFKINFGCIESLVSNDKNNKNKSKNNYAEKFLDIIKSFDIETIRNSVSQYIKTHDPMYLPIRYSLDNDFPYHLVIRGGSKDCTLTLKSKKYSMTWLICYLSNILPNKNIDMWEYFQCSHLCIQYGLPKGYYCIDPRCLVWEDASTNQSRGSKSKGINLCTRKCGHDGCSKIVCVCSNLHDPHCH